MSTTYHCPSCDSTEVFSTHEQAFMVNTDQHYLHMVKAHDSDAKAGCRDCDWRGQRGQLVERTPKVIWRYRPVHWSDLRTGRVLAWGIERRKDKGQYRPIGYEGSPHPFKTKAEAQAVCDRLNKEQP